MKNLGKITAIITLVIFVVGCTGGNKNKSAEKNSSKNGIRLVDDIAGKRVDVLVDGKPFTSFIYTDTLPALTKPVLYPLISASGDTVTRGFPLNPRPGERTDHPHHIGFWFTYGDVNHIDFWGNSPAMPPELHDKLGWIRNVKLLKSESGKDKGILEFTADWQNSKGEVMLTEHTTFTFTAKGDGRTIDRTTVLTAAKDTVVFYDTKEGMMGIRVARALELPSDKPVVLTDEHGNKTEVKNTDNAGVNGDYLTSEGVTGKEAWGKRAKWVSLHGKMKNGEESITIFDHPGNPGYPSYWHARSYGLFAINPLGQKVFSEGKKELHLTLLPGQSATFKYRVLVKTGQVSVQGMNKVFDEFSKLYQ